MHIPYQWIRPLLFTLDPELAHQCTFFALDKLDKFEQLERFMPKVEPCPVEVMGLKFPNPVGLAAGLDKDARQLDALSTLGFGFVEVGTVTPIPQSGNAKPRMFRLPEARAIINRMGFNNDGVQAMIKNIWLSRFTGVLGINIGKNALTPVEDADKDYVSALDDVYPYASYISVNISSPNTKNLRNLQGGDQLDKLLSALSKARDKLAHEHNAYRPMALKIAPDLTDEETDAIADRLKHFKFDGVIATNTTIGRNAVKGLKHAHETGGLSGAPMREPSLRVIRQLAKRLNGEIPIIGVGGIMTGADAKAKIDAGAKLVQIYTGLIYRGPELISECVEAIRPDPYAKTPAQPCQFLDNVI